MSFIIKTAPFDAKRGDIIQISERPMYGGSAITPSEEVFLWFSETKGGHGLAWLGKVEKVDGVSSNKLQVTVQLNASNQAEYFGTAQLKPFRFVEGDPTHIGLAKKLYGQSHHKIAQLTGEEADLLRNQFLKESLLNAAAQKEIARQKRLGESAVRPGQREFSRNVRQAYENRCAITGCSTPKALEAAHIYTEEGLDYNEVSNGILLRADIHALFDAGLFALTTNGTSLDLSAKLKDTSYEFLRSVKLTRPKTSVPSPENILRHRQRFGF